MSTGQELKCQGQDATWQAERAAWRDQALNLIKQFATIHSRFNADQFRRWAAEQGLSEPHHRNVWGPLYTTAASKGWIRNTQDYTQSENPAAHAHAYAWWESLLNPSLPPERRDPSQEMRFELRAPGKAGVTVASADKAKSASVIKWYCRIFDAKPKDIVFSTVAPGPRF